MRNEKQICCEFRYFHHVPGATDPQVAARVTSTGLKADCPLYSVLVSPLPSVSTCIHQNCSFTALKQYLCFVPCPAPPWLW